MNPILNKYAGLKPQIADILRASEEGKLPVSQIAPHLPCSPTITRALCEEMEKDGEVRTRMMGINLYVQLLNFKKQAKPSEKPKEAVKPKEAKKKAMPAKNKAMPFCLPGEKKPVYPYTPAEVLKANITKHSDGRMKMILRAKGRRSLTVYVDGDILLKAAERIVRLHKKKT